MRHALIALLFIFLASPLFGQTASDTTALHRAALDYIEGWYTGDAGRMEQALHPALAKRMVHPDPETEQPVLNRQNFETLVTNTREGYGTRTPESERQKEITILDVFKGAASVKIVAAQWIDYLHLVKWEGEWKIINVLWELKRDPEAR